MSDKGKDMGVFNIVNKRTGKRFTSGSTDIDQLMNQYAHKMKHGYHHNEELRKDIERGDTFRFEVVSRDCETEDEIRELRDIEINRNPNNTYNKDVKIYFDGGNPNAEFPQGKGTEKLNNVEDFPNSHSIVKTKKETRKNIWTPQKEIPKENKHEEDLIKYIDKFKTHINPEIKGELIKDINNKEITTKTQIFKIIEKKGKSYFEEEDYEDDYEDDIESHISEPRKPKRFIYDFGAPKGERKKLFKKSSIVDFGKIKEEKEEKEKKLEEERAKRNAKKSKTLINYVNGIKPKLNEEIKEGIIRDINNEEITTKVQILRRLEKEKKKIEGEKQEAEDKNQVLTNIQENGEKIKEDLCKYVDEFPISEELKKELKLRINEEKINDKPQIASIAIKARKNERLKKEIEEIDNEIDQLKRQINHLEDKLDKLKNDKKQLQKEYLIMDEETYKLEYKKIFELEKSSLGEKSRHNRRLKQLERKRKRIIEEQ